jgi:hypothetical protein
MNGADITKLYRQTCAAITVPHVSDAEVARLMAELEATGGEGATEATKRTMEWRDPGRMNTEQASTSEPKTARPVQ